MYLRFVIGPGVGRLSCPRYTIAVSKSICSSALLEKYSKCVFGGLIYISKLLNSVNGTIFI